MIMSTLTLASASLPKTVAATPGLSGTSRDRELRLRGVVRDTGDDRLFHGLVGLLDDGPGPIRESSSGSG